MARFQWLRDRWPTIRDNAVYDTIKWFFVTATGVGAYFIVKYLLPAFSGFTPDEAKLIATVVAMLVITAVSLTWMAAVTSTRQHNPRVPILPQLPQLDEAFSPPKDPNIHIEIREMLFRPIRSALFSDCGCEILIHLHMVNRGTVEPTITDWKLTAAAGDERFLGAVRPIPASMYIERPKKGLAVLAEKPINESIPRPTLDEAAREPFRRGIPKEGWIMFFLETWASDYDAPYCATFTLTLTDSMGVEHIATKASSFHKVTGAIKNQS